MASYSVLLFLLTGRYLFSPSSTLFAVFLCGFPCKNPKNVTGDDFFFSGLDIPGNTSNTLGSSIIIVDVKRIDFAPGGVNPPHIHPRATEILLVLEGTLLVGFITSNNKLIVKVLVKGDVFVFPKGLIHFQINISLSVAIAITALNSEKPGSIVIGDSIFGSHLPSPSTSSQRPSTWMRTLSRRFSLSFKCIIIVILPRPRFEC
ncbi:unnamed protein product [Spirodela intermedia]|uniref:Germin-like protein n=1 Tax=Spirodela intermedia TaxID=51605 RepID=A0A7I8IJC7_SPIIN|nr:unnamed protein product [Spirodela intermedia]CAA6657997.1 unnamed protein product [Spirodela intermedia]